MSGSALDWLDRGRMQYFRCDFRREQHVTLFLITLPLNYEQLKEIRVMSIYTCNIILIILLPLDVHKQILWSKKVQNSYHYCFVKNRSIKIWWDKMMTIDNINERYSFRSLI